MQGNLIRIAAAEPDNAASVIPESVFAAVEAAAQRHPAKPAIVAPEGTLTYAQLVAQATSLAARLAEGASGEPMPVAVLAPQGLLQITAALACFRVGLPFMPLDPGQSTLRNRQMLLTGAATTIVCDSARQAAARALAPEARMIVTGRTAPAPAAALPEPPPPQAIAFLIFTSGSTGVPRGVMHDHVSLASAIACEAQFLGLGPDDRLALIANPTVISTPVFGTLPLAVGATLLLAPDSVRVPQFLQLMASHRATRLLCFVGFARTLVRDPGAARAMAHLRTAEIYGDLVQPVDVAALRQVLPKQAGIFPLYGSSESNLMAGWYVGHGDEAREERLPIGRPMPGAELWIDADEEQSDASSKVGELLAVGPRLAAGYWRDPETTAQRFQPLDGDPARRIFRTGDIVRLRADGLLEFAGRRDNQIKLRGWRIEIEEIESAARRLPGVTAAGLVPRRGPDGAVQFLALLVAAGDDVTVERMAAHLAGALPRHMLPNAIRMVAALPLTATAKLDRTRLAELDRQIQDREATSRAADTSSLWPDDLSSRIAAAVAAELGVASIGPQDRFAEVGGDSLLAMNVALRIEKVFAVSVDPSELMGNDTLGTIVARVASSVLSPKP